MQEVAHMTTRSIERHPDILALRNKYEQANETWAAHAITGAVLMTGLYLAVSAWVVGFQALTPLAVTNVLTGLVIVGLAFGLAAAYERFHGVAWVIPALGVWTFIAPWVIRGGVDTTPAVSNNITVGTICALLGAAAIYLSARYVRR
jgi:uncharacterized membrane protein